MRIRVTMSLDIEDDKVPILTEIAKTCGHDFDGIKDRRVIIRRYLESKVRDAITYCREHLSKD